MDHLDFEQVRKDSFFLLQLSVCALFGNASIFEYNNFINFTYRTEPMGNHQYCASLCQAIQGSHDLCFGFDIQAGGWLIHDDDWCITQYGAGDSYTLPLSSRKVFPLINYSLI